MKRNTKLIALALGIALGLTLAGCAQEKPISGKEGVHTTYSYKAVTINYNGHPLYCVERSNATSCNWERYNAEYGYLNR